MKPRADMNLQRRTLTFELNIPLIDKPLEIAQQSNKRRMRKKLEECTPEGRELIQKLLSNIGVEKVNVSLHEIEVIFREGYNSTERRNSITALIVAVGGVLNTPGEHVIVTTDAVKGEDVKPDVDPPVYED